MPTATGLMRGICVFKATSLVVIQGCLSDTTLLEEINNKAFQSCRNGECMKYLCLIGISNSLE